MGRQGTLIFEIGLMALMTPSGTCVSNIYTPRFFMSGGRFLTSASLFLTGVFGLIKDGRFSELHA